MIGSLRGRIIEKSIAWVLLEVQGIGYKITVTPTVLANLRGEGETFMYIHDHIREDIHDLFGFLAMNELELFQKLLTISGVGPKSAMTLMSVGTADEIRSAIMKGDLDMLTSVPGVGKKTAQKIVLELKGQLVEPEEATTSHKEVIEALISLGYASQQAKEAVKELSSDLNHGDMIREALKFLNKR